MKGNLSVAQKVSPYSQLPPALVFETRQHLTQLQLSAAGFEANGRSERANEILEVAEHLEGVLLTIQNVEKHELPGQATAPVTGRNGHAKQHA